MPEWYRDEEQRRSRGYGDEGSDYGREDRGRERGMYDRDQGAGRSWADNDRWERGARGYSDAESTQRSRSGGQRGDWWENGGERDRNPGSNRADQQPGGSLSQGSPISWSYSEFWIIPGPFVGQGPRGYQRGDDRIKEDVCERLARHGRIDARNIEVTVEHGEVTLKGTVDSREAKRMSEDVAESVSGVHDVRNELRVQQRGDGHQDQQHQQSQQDQPDPQGQQDQPRQGGKGAEQRKRESASRTRS